VHKDKQTPTNAVNATNGTSVTRILPPPPPSQSSARLSQQEPPLTPVSGLFCTPIATEGNSSGPGTQRSHADAGGSSTTYDWTGDSIGSLHHLGVDVLTPAGLPQCTPMTVEPATTPTAEGSAAMWTPRRPQGDSSRERALQSSGSSASSAAKGYSGSAATGAAAYPMYVHDAAQYSARQTRCQPPQHLASEPPLQRRLRSSTASARATPEGTGNG
jgi:hypothetical protein